MANALDRLLDLLDLEQIEANIFRGRSPDERRQRVFGGQVAGQALVAAGRTVPVDRPVRSLHAYFIRPGDPSVPIVYLVDRVRDGRSFTTRRVSAVQHGKTIFTLSASFHHPEPGPEHDDPLLHVCLMTYASDMTLLDSVLTGHGLTWLDGRTSGASLDHAMWFHRPFRADQWLLYAQESPAAFGARGLARGEVFTADGRLVVS